MLAERAGLRIHEVPVDWVDDADSRVNVMATALGDLCGIVRLGSGLARGTISVPALRSADLHGRRLAGQLTRFVLAGVASTVAYVLLYRLRSGHPEVGSEPGDRAGSPCWMTA